MVPVVGWNTSIPLSPLHSVGIILRAGWFQARVSFVMIDNSSDMRQIPIRFYYLGIYYPELCLMPRTFQEFRGARQLTILHTHLRVATGLSRDMRFTKTAGDQLAKCMEKPTRTHHFSSLIKYFPRGIKSYTNSTAQKFDSTLSAWNQRTSAHVLVLPTLYRTAWQRASALAYSTGLAVEYRSCSAQEKRTHPPSD
jgi:hypothetical protein